MSNFCKLYRVCRDFWIISQEDYPQSRRLQSEKYRSKNQRYKDLVMESPKTPTEEEERRTDPSVKQSPNKA